MENQNTIDIAIIGAGISGLSSAAFLSKSGVKAQVFEQAEKVGGVIQTVSHNGVQMDLAANSTIDKNLQVRELVKWSGLNEDLLTASATSSKKYILKNGNLVGLKGPASAIFGPLLSWKGKLRVFRELFVPAKKDGVEESIADFVTRRFGKELLDYAINPMVAGIYAGNPSEIGVEAAFPKMKAMEDEFGSVIKAAPKVMKRNKLLPEPKPTKDTLSFKLGMHQLVAGIANKLQDQIHTQHQLKSIKPLDRGYELTFKNGNQEKTVYAKKVLFTTPSYITADLIKAIDSDISAQLRRIEYPTVAVWNLVYNQDQVGQNLDSFGYLIPEKERQSYLGATWSSVVFPDKSTAGKAVFTLYIGGSRNQKEMMLNVEKWKQKVLEEFQGQMKISGEPNFEYFQLWDKAIPQYKVGHLGLVENLKSFEKSHPGLYIRGNFVGGNAVADCIENGFINAQELK